MRPTVIVPLLAACALAGCNSGDTVTAKNESVESVAEKVAASDAKPRPGRWEASMKFAASTMQGAAQKADGNVMAICLTPEMAAKADGSQFRQAGSGCQYDTFTMAGGKIDAVMTCKHDSLTQRVTMDGTYSPEAYSLHMVTQMEIQPGKPMTTEMTMNSRRVGECNGTEITPGVADAGAGAAGAAKAR